jgi:uncharacterized protein YndB with AHSA1/START domain
MWRWPRMLAMAGGVRREFQGMRSVLLAGVLALSACASTPLPMPAAGIVDSSYSDAANTRSIQLSMYVPASPSQVYRALTTIEGWKSWAVVSAFGDIRFGGVMETSYKPEAKPGDSTNISQQFIALIPDKFVAFRTIKTPDGFPHAELYMKTIASMLLTPEGSGTRLLFTHQGFGPEPGFDELYTFFANGDRETMDSLRKLFGR